MTREALGRGPSAACQLLVLRLSAPGHWSSTNGAGTGHSRANERLGFQCVSDAATNLALKRLTINTWQSSTRECQQGHKKPQLESPLMVKARFPPRTDKEARTSPSHVRQGQAAVLTGRKGRSNTVH